MSSVSSELRHTTRESGADNAGIDNDIDTQTLFCTAQSGTEPKGAAKLVLQQHGSTRLRGCRAMRAEPSGYHGFWLAVE